MNIFYTTINKIKTKVELQLYVYSYHVNHNGIDLYVMS